MFHRRLGDGDHRLPILWARKGRHGSPGQHRPFYGSLKRLRFGECASLLQTVDGGWGLCYALTKGMPGQQRTRTRQNLRPGKSFPIGATVYHEGVNFSLFSKDARVIELLLFDSAADGTPSSVIRLNGKRNKTYHYWHVFVPGLKAGQIYGYRAMGLFQPERGLRFDPEKVLLDPYGRAVAVPPQFSRQAAMAHGDNAPWAMKSVIVDPRSYDWENDRLPRQPFTRTIIYEMHLAGFTRNPNSGVSPERRGTFAGLIEKIPYLEDLGITAVELLPIFQFDHQDAPAGLVNYWGYSPVSFFAPHGGYSSRKDGLGAVDEFRDMVKALHKAGIEVILDVVYNHTAEGNQDGPTYSFKGLQNDMYYILEKDQSHYANYTGTGNTLNANQSIVRRLIVDSLRYWVQEMHVDGFRFDLASILSRDETGNPLINPPVLWDIESDPVLAGTKLIAEAWDAAGLYQVGTFAGDSWKEWNGTFRDDVRSFLKGDRGMARAMAAKVFGSPDIYLEQNREPEQSINFVTCHDGFTLNDLVSYNTKQNEANGEGNRDGTDYNLSWNCGVEGPTDNSVVEALRERQMKNFFAVTLLSLGVPMLLMGDEVRRTQRGNNNAYCQDNETSWFDWSLVDKNDAVRAFVRRLITLRIGRETGADDGQISLREMLQRADIHWHGVKREEPDWSDGSHAFAVTVRGRQGRFLFHLMINAYWEPLTFELPPAGTPTRSWRRLMDTFLPSPEDITHWKEAPLVEGTSYVVQPRSFVALLATFVPEQQAEPPQAHKEGKQR
jgi:isoamylase